MILGKWELPPYAMLAPMAGGSDRALRELAMRFGAVVCVGEMVSCKGRVQGSRKSAELMEIGPLEMPCAIQRIGDEPEPMARAAALARQSSPAWLAMNMGCPAPKIAGNRSGSALMLDGLFARCRATLHAPDAPVIATGTLPASIRDACATPIEYNGTLILDGLYSSWKRNGIKKVKKQFLSSLI